MPGVGYWRAGEGLLDAFLEKTAAKKRGLGSVPSLPGLPEAPKPPSLPSRAQREVELWKTWKAGGHQPEHLEPLLKSLEPVIQKHVSGYRGEIPKAAIEAKALNIAIGALKKYNPEKAQINTYLTKHLSGLQRFATAYRTMGAMSEDQAKLVSPFKRAKNELADELGYDPTPLQIAQRMTALKGKKISEKQVKQLEKETKGSLFASELAYDPSEIRPSKVTEAVYLLRHDPRLSAREREVLFHSQGIEGRETLSSGQIAKKLGVQASQVSVMRKKIQKLLTETIEGL